MRPQSRMRPQKKQDEAAEPDRVGSRTPPPGGIQRRPPAGADGGSVGSASSRTPFFRIRPGGGAEPRASCGGWCRRRRPANLPVVEGGRPQHRDHLGVGVLRASARLRLPELPTAATRHAATGGSNRRPGPTTVLWWIRVGERPSLEQAKARLEHLGSVGATPHRRSRYLRQFDARTARPPARPVGTSRSKPVR